MRPSASQPSLAATMYPYELPERSDSPSRRQRISMACQYCRHRCCGGSPCRNCTRSQRECEYAPVPEEINRATREKKAMAKAAKAQIPQVYSPFFSDSPIFNVPARPLGHRRSVSVPSFDAQPWASTPPMINTPAIYHNQWIYNEWSTGPPIPAYPSVLEPPNPPFYSQNPSTPPDSRAGSSETLDAAWQTPAYHLRVPTLTPAMTPAEHFSSPVFYSPHPTPPLYHPSMFPQSMGQQGHSASPTLAPEMKPEMKPELVGLGLGMEPQHHYAPRY